MVPSDKSATYCSFVCDYKSFKKEQWYVRLVVEGDKIPYKNDSGSLAANLIDTKIFLNSVISQASKGAKFISCDLMIFFLATPMETLDYINIPYKHFPIDIRKQYNLDSILSRRWLHLL